MKPDELERLGKILKEHFDAWGFYYFLSFVGGFLFGGILLCLLAPDSKSATTSDFIIASVVATLGYTAAAVNQTIAWLRSFGERKHKKKLRRLREIKALEAELELDASEHEVVH